MGPKVAVLTLKTIILAGYVTANVLPVTLPKVARLDDYDRTRQVSGVIPNRLELMKRPRVIFGYLSEKDWAFVELVCFMHASWRYVVSLAEPTGYRLDLVVFSDERWMPEVSALCELITLEDVHSEAAATATTEAGTRGPAEGGDSYPQLQRHGNTSRCWVVPYSRPPESVWHGYPFVASYHYLSDSRVAHLLTSKYGYAMKTDFDCFISAALIQHFPTQLEVGYMQYTPLKATRERLQSVAAGLGLRHHGRHDIGPTWYGDAATLVAVAVASLPLVHWLLDREMGPHNEDGSWRRNWAEGEGWPLWSRDMAVMYATDIAMNHLVREFKVSDKYDVHGDSRRFTFALYHIHCQHGDGNFSKFEFFRHKYQDRHVTSGLDLTRVSDYALFLSVATWRQLEELQARSLARSASKPVTAASATGIEENGGGAGMAAAESLLRATYNENEISDPVLHKEL